MRHLVFIAALIVALLATVIGGSLFHAAQERVDREFWQKIMAEFDKTAMALVKESTDLAKENAELKQKVKELEGGP